jgi:hypothetical protein
MAKHVILESYTFTPSTRTIVVTGKNIRREQLLLITNTTLGTVIYNFSDPSLGASSYVNSVDATTGQETCTIVLAYNTSSMTSTDKLSILVEETYQEMTPSEVMRDPVDKLRVSTPQSLIDTDFEYGPQPTKWEQINLLNNRPSAFYDVTAPLAITGISATLKVVTVTIANTTGISVGSPVFVQGTLDTLNVDGWWIVEGVATNVSFSFTCTNTPTTTLYNADKTYVFLGSFFTGAAIPTTTSAIRLDGTFGYINTANAHGLRVGDSFYLTGCTGNTGTLNSSWIVSSTPTNSNIMFSCAATGTITSTANTLYPRAVGYIEHRAFDGGVQFTNEVPFHGYQVVRQTRRYFRYQSGKGIQFSTGSILKPQLWVESVTGTGSTVTVTTRYPHSLGANGIVKIAGSTDTAYNGTFTVATAPTGNTFTYTTSTPITTSPAPGFPITVSPFSWYGSANRLGMFDQQNGVFFEYDGQTLYAVRRTSTTQINGVVDVVTGSQSVVGTNTQFSTQLKPGDYIVIRGMSYLVQQITSDTQMYIYPEYKGTGNSTRCFVSKTIDTKYPQSSWNIDKMDGTGASLYNADLTKMQMFYIDYTWYGAGAIRFGFKNNRGEVIYGHRIPNNNVNYEAYMRSGNLPARYETNTTPLVTYLTANLASATSTGSTISVAAANTWPNVGVVVLTQSAASNAAIEYISYTAKSNTTLTIGTRAVAGGNSAAQTFTVANTSAVNPGGTSPITAELYSPQTASIINHWGSSVIMDGRFDDDKSFVFNAGMNTVLQSQTVGTRMALMSIRLAPTVDNGISGLMGVREVINRMQLTLRGMDTFTSNSAFRIELILNGKPASGTFTPVGGSSLSQIAFHAANTTITGGESIYGFFTNATGATATDLNQVRDLGNSILGGGNSLSVPTGANNLYPDGPDVVTVAATALAPLNGINARLSWTEAQA